MGYDSIRLEKGMYQTAGRSFTQVLESIDPSEQYQGTALEGLDAFQRQLKRFDIKVKGANSDCVEKFFGSIESSVLFPEFVSRMVRTGLEEHDPLPSLVATTTNIDVRDYRSVYTDCEEEDLAPAVLSEGANLPEVCVRTKDHLVRLMKFGRMLVASYEALRFQKLDLFSVMLRQIGQQIQSALVSQAVQTIIFGDGNADTKSDMYTVSIKPMSGTRGQLAYDQLVELWSTFHPYEMNTLVGNADMLTRLLKIPELQNPLTGMNFQATGQLVTPMGATMVRCDDTPALYLLAIDRRYNLELVQAGGIQVDYDRLIDRQLERAAITTMAGFSKLHGKSGKVLVL